MGINEKSFPQSRVDMILRRNAIGRITLVVAVLVIMVIALGGSLFLLSSRQATSTTSIPSSSTSNSTSSSTPSSAKTGSTTVVSSSASTSTEEQQPTSYSITAPPGLELQVKLNATSIQTGSALSAQIILFNPLNENLSVASEYSSNSTIAAWDGYDFICNGYGEAWTLAGYALFQGHYSSDNISSAGEPMTLSPPVEPPCVTFSTPDQFVFLPNSSNATAYLPSDFNQPPSMERLVMNATTEYCTSTSCPLGSSLFGYWSAPVQGALESGQATIGSTYLHFFPPGQYTLVVEDQWGQAIYAHFQVTSASARPVDVVSVTGPIPPYNPGGPVVSITLKNTGDAPIASLNAGLQLPNAGGTSTPYTFVFNVNSSDPLLPGQSITQTRTLINAGFDSSVEYPLTISGALTNGTQFSYTVQVQVVPPG